MDIKIKSLKGWRSAASRAVVLNEMTEAETLEVWMKEVVRHA